MRRTTGVLGVTTYDALRTTAALPGFERWYATEYQYAGGWLITRGAPWEPGRPERIIATVRDGETARQIVDDHNVHAALPMAGVAT